MKNLAVFVLGISLAFVLSLSLTMGAGTSTGSVQERNVAEAIAIDPVYPNSNAKTPCDEMGDMRGRIKCRLQMKERDGSGVEESCRGRANKEACLRLYRDSASCYMKDNRDKLKCFREKTNSSEKKDFKRNYLVLVLYEAQKRVEAKHNAGLITDDQAADLINAIVEAKQSILNGDSKAIVKAKIKAVRDLWKEIFGNAGVPSNRDMNKTENESEGSS